MGHRRRSRAGKIAAILAALEAHEPEVRRDLLALGRELDDGTISWADLHAVIYAAPPGTSCFRAFEKGWTTTDYLLAHLIDIEHHAMWQRAGDDREPRPEPFPRPGDKTADSAAEDTVQMGMGVTATMTTVGEFLRTREEHAARWRTRRGIHDHTPPAEGA